MRKTRPKIKYTEYGLANTLNNKERWIELNKNLNKYPKLKKEILKHELKHYYSNGIFDFFIELKEFLNTKKQREMSRFMWKHPKSLTQLLPFIWNKEGFFPDYFMLSFYTVLIAILIISIKFILKVM